VGSGFREEGIVTDQEAMAWLKSVVAAGVFLVASVQVRAQPLFPHADSIESTVANADLVVIAKLAKFGDGQRAGRRVVHEATIDIEDTLKQDVFTIEPYRRLQVYIPRPASVLTEWKQRRDQLRHQTAGQAAGRGSWHSQFRPMR
jgi:hypothetical protein